MVVAAGVDSGTYSVDIVVLDDCCLRLVFEESVPRRRVVEDPGVVVDVLRRLVEEYGVSSIVVSSGYGIALKPAGEASDWEIWAATFTHEGDDRRGHRIHGLRGVLRLVRDSGLPAWFTPGVVQLSSVPVWRKLGRIDLGTSDKVYSVAAALREEVEDRGVPVEETRLIVLEVGYAYTAAMAVRGGRIIDGVGGTTGFHGYMGQGFWDAEAAYAAAAWAPMFPREALFRGGVAELLGGEWPPPPPGEVARRAEEGDEAAGLVVEALAEAAAKDVAALVVSLGEAPERVYVGGRWWREKVFREALLEKLAPLREGLGFEVTGYAGVLGRAKEAALGAALIASGLAGGRYRWLVEALGLRESGGTVFDYLPAWLREAIVSRGPRG